MENATKALLMAGGVLLVMLVIGLLIFAWGRFSDFYNKEDELSEIQDITEFNLQFTNYDRDNVYGYELISLANKVADYNFRFSNDADAKNNQGFAPINLIINMPQDKVKANISYELNTVRLFAASTYNTISVTSGFTGIMNSLNTDEQKYGKENLQNLSKSIQSIFLDNSGGGEEVVVLNEKKNALKKFSSIVYSRYAGDSSIKSVIDIIKAYDDTDVGSIERQYQNIQTYFREVSYKYYEYTQFKKAKFISNSSAITYDSTGKINKMEFTFTGEIE